MELPFVEGFVGGSKEYARQRTRKVISKLRGGFSTRKPDLSKDKNQDDMDKGFKIDI